MRRINQNGLHPTGEKEMPRHENVTELRSFAGPDLALLNYYSKFLPNLSGQLDPLYRLLGKHAWGKEQEAAFQATKSAFHGN